jgi:hypothetical protein
VAQPPAAIPGVGTGYFPEWSIVVGWILATVPFALMLVASPKWLKQCTMDGYGGYGEINLWKSNQPRVVN